MQAGRELQPGFPAGKGAFDGFAPARQQATGSGDPPATSATS